MTRVPGGVPEHFSIDDDPGRRRAALSPLFTRARGEETDLDALGKDLVGLVRGTMQPEHVSLWLRPEGSQEGEQADQQTLIRPNAYKTNPRKFANKVAKIVYLGDTLPSLEG
jgi:hypothetical protein